MLSSLKALFSISGSILGCQQQLSKQSRGYRAYFAYLIMNYKTKKLDFVLTKFQ